MPTSLSSSSHKPRILTGDTPTNTGLHLGHYVGSLENRLKLQDEYDCYFLIANVHAFTTLADKPDQIRANTIGIVKDWLAVGLDPERSTFVLQSEIPAIAELTFLFAMLLPFNKVMRNPTLKTEIDSKGLGDTYSFGFPMYAVGQCADILAFRPELVPVGEDQEAHIEMCRDVAEKFNRTYCGVGDRITADDHVKAGGVFPVPKAKLGRVARLVGIDGVQKMSKSLNNAIFLYDTEKEVQKKMNKVVTGRTSSTSPIDPKSALVQYIDAFLPPERAAELKDAYASGKEVMDGHVKAEVAAAINAIIAPMRARREKLDAQPSNTNPGGDSLISAILAEGVTKSNRVAEQTLLDVKQKMRIPCNARRVQRLPLKVLDSRHLDFLGLTYNQLTNFSVDGFNEATIELSFNLTMKDIDESSRSAFARLASKQVFNFLKNRKYIERRQRNKWAWSVSNDDSRERWLEVANA